MTMQTIVMMILALVVLGLLIYLGYKYILQAGEQGGKAALACRGTCKEQCASDERGVFGIGCPPEGSQQGDGRSYCCSKT